YAIGDDTNVSIKLYDITGREVKELVNEKKQAGYYTIKLKADNLSSGIYFYRISTSSGYSETKKLMLLK
ncbi:MAG TPA: T9SS type A sorting domain-containing protein, partial [Ignavibacteriaceae bacterium]